MADNMMKSADRRLFSKMHGDGEDPIIIAQRFLNIFRQLHIFSAERKNAFNKMILEQPPEIRGMFGSLPGGSLLQEYVDDLEQQSGVVRDHMAAAASNPDLSDEISKAKILATALAEAQIQASAKMQQTAPQSAVPPIMPQQTQQSQTAPQNAPVFSGTAKVVADASFAKEIAAAFVQAVKFSEDNRKSDTKEITEAILASQEKIENNRKQESREIAAAIIASQEKMAQVFSQSLVQSDYRQQQSEVSKSSSDGGLDSKEILNAITESQNRMAQMIMQHNTVASSNSSNNNANNIQINTTPMPPIEDIVKGIVQAQSELFREMSQTQTKELSAIITLALKESQQMSTQTIVEAISALQKENMKFFEKQASMAPVYIQQPVMATHEASVSNASVTEEVSVPESPFEDILNTAPNSIIEEFGIKPEVLDEEQILDDAPTEILEQLTQNEVEESVGAPKKKKKKKKKKNKNKVTDSNTGTDEADELLNFGTETSDLDNGGLDISLFNSEDNSTDTKKKRKDKKSSLETAYSDDVEVIPSEVIEPESSPDTASVEEEAEWVWEEVSAIDTEEDVARTTETAGEEEGGWEYVEVPAEETDEDVAETTETAGEEEGDWEYVEVPAEETDEDIAETTEASEDEGDWEYVEVSDDDSDDDNGADTAELTETSEYHLEALDAKPTEDLNAPTEVFSFEEDSETTENQPETISEIESPLTGTENEFQFSDDLSSSSEEYKSDDVLDNEPILENTPEIEESLSAPLESPANVEESDDWEWEYEEVPEEDNALDSLSSTSDVSFLTEMEPVGEPASEVESIPLETSPQTEDEEDWEWEYEEVPEDDEALENSDLVTDNTLLTSQEPTEATIAETESNPLETAQQIDDGEEWEWEYEEVPEDELIEEPAASTATENVLPNSANAEGGEEEEWEWEYEEIPEEDLASETPENAVLSEDSEPSKTVQEQPVQISVENEKAEEEEISFGILENPDIDDIFSNPPDNLNPLHNGDLYFQDDVYQDEKEVLVPLPDIDLAIADISDENEKKEPYISKDDIIG